ncbi:tubulin-like doman-containing protein, partial [Bacteroides bouchesdurhonensis]
MSERNIFIGLGGSGVSTVAALKYKIYANTSGDDPYELINKNYKFIFIDTDQADVNKQNAYYKSKFEGGRRLFIDPKNELINLGTVNPNAVYEEALAKSVSNREDIDNAVLEACTEKLAKKLKPYPLKDGAGAYRYNSRIAFARMSYDFVDMLKTDLQQLLDTRTAGIDGVTLRYWIVGSCNGGTGSGIFTDVLYLVNMLHKSI